MPENMNMKAFNPGWDLQIHKMVKISLSAYTATLKVSSFKLVNFTNTTKKMRKMKIYLHEWGENIGQIPTYIGDTGYKKHK